LRPERLPGRKLKVTFGGEWIRRILNHDGNKVDLRDFLVESAYHFCSFVGIYVFIFLRNAVTFSIKTYKIIDVGKSGGSLYLRIKTAADLPI